jgi:hypothetical protein
MQSDRNNTKRIFSIQKYVVFSFVVTEALICIMVALLQNPRIYIVKHNL